MKLKPSIDSLYRTTMNYKGKWKIFDYTSDVYYGTITINTVPLNNEKRSLVVVCDSNLEIKKVFYSFGPIY